MVSALIGVADGSEEIEFATVYDVLVRGGFQVKTASVMSGRKCKLSRGLVIEADQLIEEVVNDSFDVIVAPGGMPGSDHLHKSSDFSKLLLSQKTQNKWIAGICAAPAIVLAPLGILKNEHAVCYPGMEELISKFEGVPAGGMKGVVTSGKVITATGPATAIEFGIEIIKHIVRDSKAKEVEKQLLFKH